MTGKNGIINRDSVALVADHQAISGTELLSLEQWVGTGQMGLVVECLIPSMPQQNTGATTGRIHEQDRHQEPKTALTANNGDYYTTLSSRRVNLIPPDQ